MLPSQVKISEGKKQKTSGVMDWSKEISSIVCASLAKSTGFGLPTFVS